MKVNAAILIVIYMTSRFAATAAARLKPENDELSREHPVKMKREGLDDMSYQGNEEAVYGDEGPYDAGLPGQEPQDTMEEQPPMKTGGVRGLAKRRSITPSPPLEYAACTSRPELRLYSGYSSISWLRPAVMDLQNILNTRNNAGLSVDGYFGSMTDRAVRNWRSQRSLSADGIVGPKTWASLCSTGTSCQNLGNPNSQQDKHAQCSGACRTSSCSECFNQITRFVVDKIQECFPQKFSCSTRQNYGVGDHPGNAVDCFPGNFGQYPSSSDKRDGDELAEWLKNNASALKVRYVIWYNRIWNSRRASEGWRNDDKAGQVTNGHYDHVHISVNSLEN